MCARRHLRRWSNLPRHWEDLQQQYNYLLVQYSDLACVGPVTCEVEWYWEHHSGGYLMLFWKRYRCSYHPFPGVSWWYCHQERHTETDKGYWYCAARGMTDSLPLCKCIFFHITLSRFISMLLLQRASELNIQACVSLSSWAGYMFEYEVDAWLSHAYFLAVTHTSSLAVRCPSR